MRIAPALVALAALVMTGCSADVSPTPTSPSPPNGGPPRPTLLTEPSVPLDCVASDYTGVAPVTTGRNECALMVNVLDLRTPGLAVWYQYYEVLAEPYFASWDEPPLGDTVEAMAASFHDQGALQWTESMPSTVVGTEYTYGDFFTVADVAARLVDGRLMGMWDLVFEPLDDFLAHSQSSVEDGVATINGGFQGPLNARTQVIVIFAGPPTSGGGVVVGNTVIVSLDGTEEVIEFSATGPVG